MRAFLGIRLPESVRNALKDLQNELAASRADVKWVSAGNLHVTVKFLDEISEAQRQAIEAMLQRIAAWQEPFLLSVGLLGAFPSVDSPRVIWVGLTEGRERLARLVEVIEREGTAIPLRREERPFSPHLTLGRVRSSRHRAMLTERLRAISWQPLAPWRVDAVTLYQSVLTPAGPRYAVLADIPLGASSP